MAAGDPIEMPASHPGYDNRLRVYRGVSGAGKQRRVDGLSWTTELACACWFALRYDLPDPAVYTARVSIDEVFFNEDRSMECDVVCKPRYPRKLRISLDQMQSERSWWMDECSGMDEWRRCERAELLAEIQAAPDASG